MNYDYLKAKKYSCHKEEDENYYILSFDNEHHIKISITAKTIFDFFNGNNRLTDICSMLEQLNIILSVKELQKYVDDILIPNAMLCGVEYKKKKDSLLWCKISLIHSDSFAFVFKKLRIFFVRPIAFFCIFLIISCEIVSVYELLKCNTNFMNVNSIGILIFGMVDMVIHEFGHISAAYYCGINAGMIGIGIYIFYPVMFVDMTNAWKLKSKKRALVDIGGIYFQLLLIIPFTLTAILFNTKFLYVVNVSFLLATFFNLLPITKLDGYWFYCDLFKLDNLSHNSFNTLKTAVDLSRAKNKMEYKLYIKERRNYLVFSILYLFSVICAICIAVFYAISVIVNFNIVIIDFINMYKYIVNFDFGEAICLLNEMFIYILPLLFCIVMIIKCFLKKIKNRLQANKLVQ